MANVEGEMNCGDGMGDNVRNKKHKAHLAVGWSNPPIQIIRRDYEYHRYTYYHYNVASVTPSEEDIAQINNPVVRDTLRSASEEDRTIRILFNPPVETWRLPPNNGNVNNGLVRIQVESKVLQRLHLVCGYNLVISLDGTVYRNTFRNGRRFPLLLSEDTLKLEVNSDGSTNERTISMIPGLFGLFELHGKFNVTLEWNGPEPFLRGAVMDYKKLRLSQYDLDFEIITNENNRVKCYSKLLAVVSPVFAAMLATDMCESVNRELRLKDFDSSTINAFLEYVLDGSILGSYVNSEICFKLFYLGHRYQISELENATQELLENKASNWFSTDTAIWLYCFASGLYNGGYLVEKSRQILESRKEEVGHIQDFSRFAIGFPHLKDIPY